MQLGEWLTVNKITLKQAGIDLSVSQMTLWRWLKKVVIPTPPYQRKIRDYTKNQVSPEDWAKQI